MKILCVNAGSSSLKFQLVEMPEEKLLISGYFEKIGLKDSFWTTKVNGKKFKRLIGTTGGVKQNSVMFCSEEIYKDLREKLDNGRNKEIPIVPAKLEAYTALSCSVFSLSRRIPLRSGISPKPLAVPVS